MSALPEKTNGRWVLVTGGSRGIGRGIVEALARDNFAVVFTYESAKDAANEVETAVAQAGGKATGYRCNSTDEEQVRSFSRAMLSERGAPYAVINNVGITRDSFLLSMTSGQWHDVINTNLN